MQTTISCPRCRAPFPAEIFQIVDAQRTPQLKEMLLAGALNVAQCPQCGTATQLAAPLMYHDADHSLLIVFVPMELNLPMAEQERLIGQLTKAVTDNTPPEKFRAYMLQPQTVMTMKTFMEKVYATVGITPEMLDRQQKQMTLLQDLVRGDKAQQEKLVSEQEALPNSLLDETFFAMLQSMVQSALEREGNEQQLILLGNVQARLLTTTAVGQAIEKRQIALRQFQQQATQHGGLTYELLADTLIANMTDEATIGAILNMAQQGLGYELFAVLVERMEAATAAGETERAAQIEKLRDDLLQVHEEMQSQTEAMFLAARETLTQILNAPDTAVALQQHLDQINEPFLYLLAGEIEQATETKDQARLARLQKIQELLMAEAEKNVPPPIRLINQLLQSENPQQQIAQLPAEARQQLAQLISMMLEQPGMEQDPATAAQLRKLQTLFG